jgi:hemerythrin-like domain-containing protein
MVATEALKNDHRVIEKVLHVLEAASKKIDQGGEVPIDVLKKAADFIRNFADSYHHGKEENLLFKSMEEKGFRRECCTIGVMLMEHDEGRLYVRVVV